MVSSQLWNSVQIYTIRTYGKYEADVDFEWRRTEWTDDFASNTGRAYLYDETMESDIRNL